MNSKDVICPYPWTHFSTHTDGRMRICCNTSTSGDILDSDGNPIYIDEIKNIKDYFNQDFYKNIRKQMLNGDRPNICSACYSIEDKNGTSVRNGVMQSFEVEKFTDNTDLETGEIINLSVESLDLSWSNKCNLQCKMCGPWASNQLETEYNDLYKFFEPLDNNKWSYKNLKITLDKISATVTELLVTGGEPLLNNDFLEFCDYLHNNDLSKNIIFTFHTNLTIMPKKFFDRLSKFKMVRMHISIDAVGDLYEYVRYPGKWSVVDRNFRKLIELIENHPTYEVEIHTVFQTYGIHGFVDILKYFNQFSHIENFRTIPYFIWPYSPSHSCTSILRKKHKQKLKNQILKHADKMKNDRNTYLYNQLIACINLMETTKPKMEIEQFKAHVEKQDNYRKQDTKKYLPWLYLDKQ